MSGLILPPGVGGTPQVQEQEDPRTIEPYESEKPKLLAAGRQINERLARMNPTEAEAADVIIECYAKAGFKVTVNWKKVMTVDGVLLRQIPDVTLIGRIDSKDEAFDHDRQSWEIQHDVLGVDPNPGSIQPDGSIKSVAQVTSLSTRK